MTEVSKEARELLAAVFADAPHIAKAIREARPENSPVVPVFPALRAIDKALASSSAVRDALERFPVVGTKEDSFEFLSRVFEWDDEVRTVALTGSTE